MARSKNEGARGAAAPTARRGQETEPPRRWWRQQRWQRLALWLVLSLVLTLLCLPRSSSIPTDYAPGDIVPRDIKAPRDYLLKDHALTREKQQQAAQKVLPLYDFSPDRSQQAGKRLQTLLRHWQQGQKPQEPLPQEIAAAWETLPPGQRQGVQKLAQKPHVQQQLNRFLHQLLDQPIAGEKQLFQDQPRIQVRRLQGAREWVLSSGEQRIRQREKVLAQLPQQLQQQVGLASTTAQGVTSLLQQWLKPNLTFNQHATEQRREKARQDVNPVLYQLKQGEMIVREGERLSRSQARTLAALQQNRQPDSLLRRIGALFGITALLLWAVHFFGLQNVRKYRPDRRDLLFLALALVLMMGLLRLGIVLADSMEAALPYITAQDFYYLWPCAFGSMLVRMVLNSETAYAFTGVGALLAGATAGGAGGIPVALYTLVGGVMGAHGVCQCKQRTQLYRAGLLVGAVNVVMVVGLQVNSLAPLGWDLLAVAGLGAASGLLAAMLVTGIIPAVEALFKYSTDIRLMELANPNAPMLRELMVRAPGSYHHSIVVGHLAEAAAEAIGANPLLTRVAAYYHDVGKLRKPLYFVENIQGAANRHERLAPSMSALILISHVKDGVELARRGRLSRELLDIIQQHHGTALIKYFYEKAKNQNDGSQAQVDERDYRYPGPKPQSREAALIMLADAVEATSRTLTDPSPARIQGLVQKIINNIFIDGQLDECNLTLKDLHSIAKSFNRILTGIFHQRIDYPEPAYKVRDKKSMEKVKDGSVAAESTSPTHRSPSAGEGGADDLKRLGMS